MRAQNALTMMVENDNLTLDQLKALTRSTRSLLADRTLPIGAPVEARVPRAVAATRTGGRQHRRDNAIDALNAEGRTQTAQITQMIQGRRKHRWRR
jgi:hypothetical protein